MALLVFLRGMNVGGHRRLRPAALARELAAYDVVNVGAAGTFVVRSSGRRGTFLAELRRRLPGTTVVAWCESRELVSLANEEPFRHQRARRDFVPFVSVLSATPKRQVARPVAILIPAAAPITACAAIAATQCPIP